jgi:transcriptional regulator with XRE-family HTH domain
MGESIGKSIRRRRKQLKITQPHLAELAEVHVNTITAIEREQGNPTLDILQRIADVLGLEIRMGIRQPNEVINS